MIIHFFSFVCFAEVGIRFGRPSYTFNESDGTGTIDVIKVGVSSDPIEVRVTGGRYVAKNEK